MSRSREITIGEAGAEEPGLRERVPCAVQERPLALWLEGAVGLGKYG